MLIFFNLSLLAWLVKSLTQFKFCSYTTSKNIMILKSSDFALRSTKPLTYAVHFALILISLYDRKRWARSLIKGLVVQLFLILIYECSSVFEINNYHIWKTKQNRTKTNKQTKQKTKQNKSKCHFPESIKLAKLSTVILIVNQKEIVLYRVLWSFLSYTECVVDRNGNPCSNYL